MKDLIFLLLLILAICCLHATSNNNQLSKSTVKLLEPRNAVFYYAWPGIQTESAGSRGMYKVGNKKHNPQHIKPQFND
jgi:hypothetical protein